MNYITNNPQQEPFMYIVQSQEQVTGVHLVTWKVMFDKKIKVTEITKLSVFEHVFKNNDDVNNNSRFSIFNITCNTNYVLFVMTFWNMFLEN